MKADVRKLDTVALLDRWAQCSRGLHDIDTQGIVRELLERGLFSSVIVPGTSLRWHEEAEGAAV